MTRTALLLTATLATSSLAASSEACKTVALHPVVVNGADLAVDRGMISEIQAVAAAEFLKRQRALQDSSIVSEALAKLPARECSDNECLAKLARDTKSDCTAYFAVTPNAGRNVFLSARLIPAADADHPVFVRSEHFDRVGKTAKDWSISALQRFIRAVPLVDLVAAEPLAPLVPKSDGPKTSPPDNPPTVNLNPPTPSQTSTPAPATAAPAPATSSLLPYGLDWRTPVGGGLAVAGLGAAIAGAVAYQQAIGDWNSVIADGQSFSENEIDQVVTAHRSATTKMQLGSAGMLGGAALAAAGAGLLAWQFLGPPAEPPKDQAAKVACGFSAGGAIHCALSFP